MPVLMISRRELSGRRAKSRSTRGVTSNTWTGLTTLLSLGIQSQCSTCAGVQIYERGESHRSILSFGITRPFRDVVLLIMKFHNIHPNLLGHELLFPLCADIELENQVVSWPFDISL